MTLGMTKDNVPDSLRAAVHMHASSKFLLRANYVVSWQAIAQDRTNGEYLERMVDRIQDALAEKAKEKVAMSWYDDNDDGRKFRGEVFVAAPNEFWDLMYLAYTTGLSDARKAAQMEISR